MEESFEDVSAAGSGTEALEALRQRVHEESMRRTLAQQERDDIEEQLQMEAQRVRQAERTAAELAVREDISRNSNSYYS